MTDNSSDEASELMPNMVDILTRWTLFFSLVYAIFLNVPDMNETETISIKQPRVSAV